MGAKFYVDDLTEISVPSGEGSSRDLFLGVPLAALGSGSPGLRFAPVLRTRADARPFRSLTQELRLTTLAPGMRRVAEGQSARSADRSERGARSSPTGAKRRGRPNCYSMFIKIRGQFSIN